MNLSKFILTRVLGWKMLIEEPVPEPKAVILGVPHTCIGDFFIFFLYTRAMGDRMSVMMKKEFFKWPLSPILRKCRVIPVDRARGAGVLKQTIEAFSSREHIHLALAPEGTRKPVKRWKKGFHAIAHSAGVPVYLGHFEWKKKEISYGPRFVTTDDAEADLREIQRYYKNLNPQGRHPERTVYPDGI